jgi:hypothetical protein
MRGVPRAVEQVLGGYAMRYAPLATLLLFGLVSPPSLSLAQQAGKKPKGSLASAIDSAASSMPGKLSPIAEDGEFLRRVMLDLVGYPPNLEQVKAFIADPNPNKRSDKIDQLLASEEWADRTARLFCEGWFGDYHKIPIMVMPVLGESARSRLITDFVAWLKGKLHKDAPYNKEIVDAIIRARGTGTGDPSMLWKLSCFAGDEAGAVEFANRFSKHFLGIRLKCAQCHDHPFDHWKTHDFYNLAAFFGRTRATGGTDAEIREAVEGAGGVEAKTAKGMGGSSQPQFINGQKPGKNEMWMDDLAVYATLEDSGQIAMALSNRVWSWLFGRGLVHPVDDFNQRQQPLGGGLLGSLAKEFKSNKFSVKYLYSGICNSDTYQRASANEAKMARPSFGAAWIKHLDAEQLLNSIQVATTGRPASSVSEAMRMVEPLFPADVVWCEVTPLPGNMRQALLVRNNGQIQSLIGSGINQLRGASTSEKVTDMFLAVLSRNPTPSEVQRFVKYIEAHSGQGFEDAYWTLMNTTEFLSRH